MSLPWFPFKLKDFLANTKRLNTEAKGAYLLLMLDYYEREQGPPDDDEVLATICELSPEAWQRHRKVIAPLFEIKDGIWTDKRIEDEIRDGRRRYEQTVAASAAAKAAREAKKNRNAWRTDAGTDTTESATVIATESGRRGAIWRGRTAKVRNGTVTETVTDTGADFVDRNGHRNGQRHRQRTRDTRTRTLSYNKRGRERRSHLVSRWLCRERGRKRR